MSISEEFIKLFRRDLSKLKDEVLLYSKEDDLWLVDGEIKNTAGNLAMHLTGNLQHFIGHVLAGTNYERDREFEFGGKKSKGEIVHDIDDTIEVLASYFGSVSDDAYKEDYPLEVFGERMTSFFFISHLYGHLNYHLGQVNYHRRIVANY